MTSDFDVSQYISIFLDEAEEQIQIMDDNILLLEKNNEDVELLNNIFRAAHTIKGSSASMGFEKMAQVTHDLENILEELRQKRLSVSTAIIDLLLESLDAIKVLKQDIAEGKESEIDVAPLIEKLKTFRQIEGTEAISVADAARDKARDEIKSNITFDDIEENLVREVQLRGYNVWQIVVTLVDDCLMKAARAYIVYNNLTDLGEIIKTVPTIEDIEAEKFDKEFQLIIATKEDLDRVENTIKSISEIDSVSVSRVYLDDEVAAAVEDAIDKKMKRSDVESKKIVVGQTVRVDVQRLESLMNLVGELVIDKIRLADIQETLKTKCEAEETVELLDEISLHIGRISTDLQEEIMKARMFPIDQVFNRFPRMVRDLSQKANKEIDFIVEGRETELDRTVIEEIGDPLIHLLRNAIDHGIETPDVRQKAGKSAKGTITLKAVHRENQIIITVEDDGKGIDPAKIAEKAVNKGLISEEAARRLTQREALNLIFMPGFSTAETVSSVSGRGVGMDIVRSHIEKINGIVEVATTLQQGSKFTIKLPLTLAINRSLLVKLGEQVFAFPLTNVVEIINVSASDIEYVRQQEVVLVRGEVLPLYDLDCLLGIEREKPKRDKCPVVVVGLLERQIGIVVDKLIGEQEIVIKSLGEYIGKINGIAGGTIMGDGTVALILDVRGMMEEVRVTQQ